MDAAGPAGEEDRERMAWFNALPAAKARELLLGCCAAPAWAEGVAAGRPYRDRGALLAASDRAVGGLSQGQLGEALAGHPRIGQRGTGAEGSLSAGWSRQEQSGMAGAGQHTRQAIAELGAAYEDRFGHIYLVRAAGRGADELLALLRQRLGHDEATEWRAVATELAEINRIRLGKLLAGVT